MDFNHHTYTEGTTASGLETVVVTFGNAFLNGLYTRLAVIYTEP